ncbi:hypothetical protein [Tumebacillus flagellatus]|uniref:hypothetical protein n=1 Tax=Tumebacillus flagellatus TaxID=1157490 RepID=UPI001268AC8B|nr:hypothetical protein [Tumebacillus flagellatus]
MKKSLKWTLAVIVVLVIGGAAGVYAEASASNKAASDQNQNQQPNKPWGNGQGKGGRAGMGQTSFQQNTELQTLLKLSADDLTSQLQAGKTLAEIASAQGVDKQAVVDLLLKQETARLDQQVKDGKMTSDQEAQMKTNLSQRVEAQVDGKGFGGPRGGNRGSRNGQQDGQNQGQNQ